jgi:hypothetical protein
MAGGNWKILTILGAISVRLDDHHDDHRGGEGCGDLLCLSRSYALPAVPAGDVVVMDNLSSHKVAGVRERIEKTTTELLYLPALLARPQPHQEGLGQTQTATPRR